MVIVKTKVLSPTNSRGTRIKATANGFSATISYPYAKSYELAHYEAVKWLVIKHELDWDISNMGYGSDDDGYYFTFKHSTLN